MKFYIYTLGCKVNSYESRVMADLLQNAGYLENTEDINNDICVINTCSVTNSADHKSAKIIRSAIRKNPEAIIIVAGCFSQANADVVQNIEGVDIVLGNKYKSKIVSFIDSYRENHKKMRHVEDIMQTEFEPMQLNNFNKTRAFVKIQDGCNNFCSYCIIPYTRGGVRSKKREDVLEEVTSLVQNGHKEIVLTGIHTGNYGAEVNQENAYDFADLLGEIVKIKGLERLRISSIEMNEINDRVLEVMKKYPVLVDHMHIPLQSGSDAVLKGMNRKYTKAEFMQKMMEIRNIRPHISITTDVIVGFPGETEEHFMESVETIREIGFTKIHVFPYSKRKGTVAASMKNQVPEEIKKERVHQLLKVSKELEIEYMQSCLDKEYIMIPEVYKDGYVYGHTGNYLSIKSKGMESELGQDKKVYIKRIEYPYLIGDSRSVCKKEEEQKMVSVGV